MINEVSWDGATPAVRTLGTFAVLRDGRPVPPRMWQSRKARDVLKILVARRGRPVRRDVLMEALWPEQDPARTANRLSVALSILRAVLDPGREGKTPVIVADRYAVALDTARVEIDVEAFLELAADGLGLWRRGSREEGLAVLEAAERAYAGDFLEDEPDADWAVPLREEARAAYLAVAELLASASPDPALVVGYRLRMLELDPFDEGSHLALVAGLTSLGRHGEALRAYARYRKRMREIGIEPAPALAA